MALWFNKSEKSDYATLSSSADDLNSKITFSVAVYDGRSEDYGLIIGFAESVSGVSKAGEKGFQFQPCLVRLKFPKREYTEQYQERTTNKKPSSLDLLVNNYFGTHFRDFNPFAGLLRLVSDDYDELISSQLPFEFPTLIKLSGNIVYEKLDIEKLKGSQPGGGKGNFTPKTSQTDILTQRLKWAADNYLSISELAESYELTASELLTILLGSKL